MYVYDPVNKTKEIAISYGELWNSKTTLLPTTKTTLLLYDFTLIQI